MNGFMIYDWKLEKVWDQIKFMILQELCGVEVEHGVVPSRRHVDALARHLQRLEERALARNRRRAHHMPGRFVPLIRATKIP